MSRSSQQSYNPRTEYIDKKDLRSIFALKRPEDFKKMQAETRPFSTDWPPNFSGHSNYLFNLEHGLPSWGTNDRQIPVMREQAYTQEDFESDNSSTNSKDSAGSSNGQPLRARITREPRVHHIPILVEARDDASSGYASDNTSDETKPTGTIFVNSRNFHPSATSYGTTMHNETKNIPNMQHKPCARSRSDQPFGTPLAPPRGRKASSQPPSSPPASGTPQPGQFKTTIKFSSGDQGQPQKKTSPQPSPPIQQPDMPIQQTPNIPTQEIVKVLNEMLALQEQVQSYSGNGKDKRYRQLDESLTQCMLKLDDIDTDGRKDIRQHRKEAVKKIQECISLLESKVSNPKDNPNNDKKKAIINSGSNAQEAMDSTCSGGITISNGTSHESGMMDTMM